MDMKRRDFLKLTAAGVGAAACGDAGALMQRAPREMPPEAVGMLYDSTLCIGCKACMVACKGANGMPPDFGASDNTMWDQPLDIDGKTLNIIKVYRDGSAAVKDREVDGFAFIKRHCLHCVDPSCISVCPVSAMTKDPLTGIVEHHKERCIGCRYCVYGCPFSVPKYEFDNPFGQIQKCQFCAHLQAKGLTPACCDVCPTGASLFGKVGELRDEAHRRLAARPGQSYEFPRGNLSEKRPGHEAIIPAYLPRVYGEKELGGTQVMYLSAVPFDKLGLPDNVPDYGYATISEGIQHTLYQWMIAPLAVLAGLLFVVRRNTRRTGDGEADSGRDQT